MWRWLLWPILLWPAVLLRAQNICGSMELRTVADFRQIRNCSLIVGHVHIAQLQLDGNVSLSELQSEATEITDYLMIYRSLGLLTLESIFPKLQLIRGQQLLFNQYALVVYENLHLRELGLISLLRVQNGDIRINSNPMLCFVHSIDWMYLLANTTQQRLSFKLNKSVNHCPVCDGLAAGLSRNEKRRKYCWNMQSHQLRPTAPRTKECPAACGRDGCDAAGNCCQRSCLTGCSAHNCTLCATFERNGNCVDQCIASYQLNKRQCISYKECRQRGLIPLTSGYRCVDRQHCPANHQAVEEQPGLLSCQLNCQGVFHMKRMADLEQLQDCTIINGSLILELVNIKEKIVSTLEQVLGSIKEITGYLKVFNSAHLMSYSLFVVNNHNLEHIWAPNRQVAIQRGTVFFHLNPRLCYEKITKLQSSLKSVSKISVADVSRNSNGERVICNSSLRSLQSKIADLNSTAVLIVLDYIKSEDMETLIGYSFHYMEAPQRNVTMYDGRHGCGHDDWLMDVSPSQSRRHIIYNLKPYTQYAYFVKTLTRTDYHMRIDAYSEISYFRTLPSKPSPVSRIYGSSEHSTEITVHWWPPRRPNGVIASYIINYEADKTIKETPSLKTYFTFKATMHDVDCVCNDLEPYNSGPLPEDEKFYNKEQLTYEDSLPNLIYVSRKQKKEKKKKYTRVIDFNDMLAGELAKKNQNINTTTTTTTTTTEGPEDPEAARTYELYRQSLDDKMRSDQDEGKDNYTIAHAAPKCKDPHAAVSYQLEQKCTVEQEITGIRVAGTQQFYNLTNLQPNQTYRITVRACVEGVLNGCSNPTEILLSTINNKMEQIMNSN
ncbi:CG3837 [Drosophila busckii]|uniref:CG3837 n=1 Tax=Drosophila busckii TaxID=30019 RepID=A0A0M4ENZ8_DROBS|nr:CG3837 [Drosophila busckii]